MGDTGGLLFFIAKTSFIRWECFALNSGFDQVRLMFSRLVFDKGLPFVAKLFFTLDSLDITLPLLCSPSRKRSSKGIGNFILYTLPVLLGGFPFFAADILALVSSDNFFPTWALDILALASSERFFPTLLCFIFSTTSGGLGFPLDAKEIFNFVASEDFLPRLVDDMYSMAIALACS